MTEEVKNEVVESSAEQKPEQQGNDLNINDLVAVKSIIDVASQRGAFKAGELESVGKIYNKLSSFLESAAQSAKKD